MRKVCRRQFLIIRSAITWQSTLKMLNVKQSRVVFHRIFYFNRLSTEIKTTLAGKRLSKFTTLKNRWGRISILHLSSPEYFTFYAAELEYLKAGARVKSEQNWSEIRSNYVPFSRTPDRRDYRLISRVRHNYGAVKYLLRLSRRDSSNYKVTGVRCFAISGHPREYDAIHVYCAKLWLAPLRFDGRDGGGGRWEN